MVHGGWGGGVSGVWSPGSAWIRRPSLEREEDVLFTIQTSWAKTGTHASPSLGWPSTPLEGLQTCSLFAMGQSDWIFKNQIGLCLPSFSVSGIKSTPCLSLQWLHLSPAPTQALSSGITGHRPCFVYIKSSYSSQAAVLFSPCGASFLLTSNATAGHCLGLPTTVWQGNGPSALSNDKCPGISYSEWLVADLRCARHGSGY